MEKKHFKVLTLILFILFNINSSMTLAHSGRTDKYGGHYDTSTGLYHYHNDGYSTSNNEDGSVSKNIINNSISYDPITGKLKFPPLEQFVKTWDREYLEKLYVENMNYYGAETDKLENKILTLDNQVMLLESVNSTLKKEISVKENQIENYNKKIQAYESANKKLRNEKTLLIVILVLGATLLLIVCTVGMIIKNKNKNKK